MSANSEPRPEPRPEPRHPADTATHTATHTAVRVVVLPKHLHARPAGQLAQLAARHHPTTIELAHADRHANARSVLAVMALGAVTGTHLHLTVTGPDATTIADHVVDLLQTPETEG